jgi:hypothetical protein
LCAYSLGILLDDEQQVIELLQTPTDDHQFDFGPYSIVPNVFLVCSVDDKNAIRQERAFCTLRSNHYSLGPAETTSDLELLIKQASLHALTSYANEDGTEGIFY